MSDNVGLSTPRGSGTSGYVQRNLALLKPRDRTAPYPKDADTLRHRQRQPNKSILDHDRKREVEVKVFELRDKLEEEELDDQEIDRRCDALREKLLADLAHGIGPGPKRNIKSHQVHELAEAKIKESERLRKALKISKDYEEGGHWRRQEERMRKAVEGGQEQEQESVGARDGDEGNMGRAGRDKGGEREDRGTDRRYRERECGRERDRSYSRSRSAGPRSRSRSWSRSRSRSGSPRYRSRSRSRSRSEGYRRRRD